MKEMVLDAILVIGFAVILVGLFSIPFIANSSLWA